MFALPYGDNKDNEIFSGYTACDELRRKVEPAGKFFEEYVQKKLVKYESLFEDFMHSGTNDDDIFIEEDEQEYEWEKEYKEGKSKVKETILFSNKDNYYALLGIEELFLNATIDDIRRGYKKMVLIYHPDKNQDNISLESPTEQGETNKDEKDEVDNDENEEDGVKRPLTEEEKKKLEINKKWLKIKEAYETLLDPEKKKKYDSTFEFDDAIPEEDASYKTEKKYFRTFGPVFLRNSIWSKRKPIPKIGDMDTPLNKVKRFYQFWYNFDTWRDFSVEGEHNLEEASCRYEKRAMLKENKKLKASMIKDEKVRLTKLVAMAYKNDPRIILEEERVKQEKEKVRLERAIQKQKEKEEEEERVRSIKSQYEDNLRRQKESVAKEKENYIQALITMAGNLEIILSKEDVFNIQFNGKIDNIKRILDEVEKNDNPNEKARTYKIMTSSTLHLKFLDIVDKKESSIWTKDEMVALQKAVKKYPVGVKDRSERLCEVIKGKSTNQIIKMIHFLSTNPSIKHENEFDLEKHLSNQGKPKKEAEIKQEKEIIEIVKPTVKPTEPTQSIPGDVWSDEQQKALEVALKKYPSTFSVNERWNKISREVPGKTRKDCVDRYKYLSSILNKK